MPGLFYVSLSADLLAARFLYESNHIRRCRMTNRIVTLAVASGLLVVAAPVIADHNSKNGEGWANMPNDIHNMRIETREANDNEAFRDFVKHGEGATSENRFATDDAAAPNQANNKQDKSQVQERKKTQAETATNTRTRSETRTRTRVETPASTRGQRASRPTRSGARKGGSRN